MRKVAFVGVFLTLAAASSAQAQPVRLASPITTGTVINFNSLSPFTQLTNQFAGQGLTISSTCFETSNLYSAALFGGDPMQATNFNSQLLDCNEGTAFPTVKFNFSSSQTYFGFQGISQGNILFTNNNGSISLAAPIVPGGTFVGFTDATGFNTVTISGIGNPNNSAIALDNLVFGVEVTATPEPATAALMLTGFLAIGAVAKRKRAQG